MKHLSHLVGHRSDVLTGLHVELSLINRLKTDQLGIC